MRTNSLNHVNYDKHVAKKHIDGLVEYFFHCIEDSYFEGSYENIRQKELDFLEKMVNEMEGLLYELTVKELEKYSFERIFRNAMEERVCDFFNDLSQETLDNATEESIERVFYDCSRLAIRYLKAPETRAYPNTTTK